MVTCGGCHRTYPYDAVYGGRYDMPEVELNCPNCSIQLRGPKGDLLGKPCPSCNRTLPYGSKKTVWIVLVVIVASILLIVLSR